MADKLTFRDFAVCQDVGKDVGLLFDSSAATEVGKLLIHPRLYLRVEDPALIVLPSRNMLPKPLDNDFWALAVHIMAVGRTKFFTRCNLLTVLTTLFGHVDLTSFT
jgi:hypothetical protein